VLPSWFLVLSVILIIGGAAFLVVDVATDDAPAATGTSSPATPPADVQASPTTEPSEPSPEPSVETSPEPEPTSASSPAPEPSETTPAPVARTAPVAVFNNTRTAGLAATYSGRVKVAGWTVSAVGNWRGSIVSNTVYYPAGLEAQGRQLAADLGVGRIMPAVAPMSTDRLTLVLSGPQ